MLQDWLMFAVVGGLRELVSRQQNVLLHAGRMHHVLQSLVVKSHAQLESLDKSQQNNNDSNKENKEIH